MMKLPEVKEFKLEYFNPSLNRVLILAEGFEDRSLSWIRMLPQNIIFKNILAFKYIPPKKTRLEELLAEASPRSKNEIRIINFDRYDPTLFEEELSVTLKSILIDIDEIVIDISVMSKLMILVIINIIQSFEKTVRIIYTEPKEYAPTEEEYKLQKDSIGKPTTLPSYGVHDVVRTPGLSSVIMQGHPILIVTFTSFNEQLIRALLSSINPTHLILINGVPPHLTWRERATHEIHSNIISEYSEDNQVSSSNYLLKRRTSTLYYEETFKMLSDLYNQNCINYRIVVAPTGSKLQSLACALFKICCPDVHIEYPTPESFYIKGYSSKDYRTIHEIKFSSFKSELISYGDSYDLNG